jgi:hypothetical protein
MDPRQSHRAGRGDLQRRAKKLIDLAAVFINGGEFKVLPGNRDVWRIFELCKRQWRTGFNGYTGLDFGTIRGVAHDLAVSTAGSFWEKIGILEEEILKIINAKGGNREACDEKQKGKCAMQHGKFLDWACKNCKKRGS